MNNNADCGMMSLLTEEPPNYSARAAPRTISAAIFNFDPINQRSRP